MPSTSVCGRVARRCALLPIVLVGTIASASAQNTPLQINQDPTKVAIFKKAAAKWRDSEAFAKVGNVTPAAISLQAATQLVAQVPKSQLADGDLMFIAYMETAYAGARYQEVGAQPNAQTWGAYLQAADEAKVAIDAAGSAVHHGKPAASALIMHAQIDLMNCNYAKSILTAHTATELYPPGKKEYDGFVKFVENAQKNGNGPCERNRVTRSAELKQYYQDLRQLLEVLDTTRKIASLLE